MASQQEANRGPGYNLHKWKLERSSAYTLMTETIKQNINCIDELNEIKKVVEAAIMNARTVTEISDIYVGLEAVSFTAL